jgi:hypothetical protein
MRGSALQNSVKTPIPAHLWPFRVDENCDILVVPGASQFFRYLLETAGSIDQDTNARASAAKLRKNSYSRAFVAL